MIINSELPSFCVQAYHAGSFKVVSNNDLKGKWSVLFFYPADFSYLCPLELKGMIDNYERFQSIGVEIYSASTDSQFVHKAWCDISEDMRHIQFPMLADPACNLSRSFGVLNEEDGMAFRATFVANPDGIIKLAEMMDNHVTRNADELYRKIRAAQFVAKNTDRACPARWQDGDEGLKPRIDLIGKL